MLCIIKHKIAVTFLFHLSVFIWYQKKKIPVIIGLVEAEKMKQQINTNRGKSSVLLRGSYAEEDKYDILIHCPCVSHSAITGVSPLL